MLCFLPISDTSLIGKTLNAQDNDNIYFFGTNIDAGTHSSSYGFGKNLDQFSSDSFQLHLGEFSLEETKAGYLQKITVGVGRDVSNKENGLVIWKETSSPFSNLFDVTGKLLLNNYGSGNITGTATYRLGVDVSGNVIEVADGGGTVTGSGTTNTIPLWGNTTALTDSILSQTTPYIGVNTGILDINGTLKQSSTLKSIYFQFGCYL
mgnify:CR=1 FL=1